MGRFFLRALPLFCAALLTAAEPRLVVTVVDQFGAPLTDLKAEDFVVLQENSSRQIQRAGYRKDLVDVALLLESSAYTSAGRQQIERIAGLLVSQLAESEQMAIVSYATSADLMQEFTSSKSLLMRGVAAMRYGNAAAILDSVYATLDGGFEQSAGRRVLLIVSSGEEGHSRVQRSEVQDLARRNRVSIFSISLSGSARSLLEKLAEESAGAYFGGRETRQMDALAKNLFAAFRGHYELAVGPLDGKFKVEVRNPREKLQVTCRKSE